MFALGEKADDEVRKAMRAAVVVNRISCMCIVDLSS